MTKQINVGGVLIGGGAEVPIQSMTNTPTHDVEATVRQIDRLASAGCDIVRVAVPDMAAAKAVGAIRERIGIPLVVDIHFDYRLALECVAAGCDKVRITPHAVAGLTSASGWLDTLKGRISVSWRVVDGQMTVEKSVPSGVTLVGL